MSNSNIVCCGAWNGLSVSSSLATTPIVAYTSTITATFVLQFRATNTSSTTNPPIPTTACTGCLLPNIATTNTQWSNFDVSTCSGINPNAGAFFTPIVADTSNSTSCVKTPSTSSTHDNYDNVRAYNHVNDYSINSYNYGIDNRNNNNTNNNNTRDNTSTSPPPLASIGLLNVGESSGWWDESPWGDYNSTGLNDTANIGYCMAIAYDSQTVEIGQWVSVACTEDYLPFVCKKLAYGTPTAATTTVSQEVCTNCELPSTNPNDPGWTNYNASTCDGFDPNTASLHSPVVLDNSTTEQCQKLVQCNFAEGEILYAIVTYVATNATWCVPLQLDSETAAFPLICNSSIGQYEDIFGWAIYHVIGCGNGVSTTTTEAPTTSTPAPDCEVPDEVCAVLMIDQLIVLPIMDYLNDPIALVQVFLTNGNCSDNSSEIEHGSTFTAACPIVSGAAGLLSSFFEMIGVQDYISEAGFYVTTFQIAFNAIFSSVQAGVDGVTTQMCPEWIPDDVTTTTASP
ncbi:hypothetical protein WR25_13353 [Diploscapter pachys]|uniref:C-type lectin domain-containing protein n=1 Tax=Diploscapter pachys TaxID=2018661 RepID=A0A2A2J8U6_9BILA|nr:hypothetical protein WR25_13353 [Diploscapter pachys]